jgi:hypothetical protein
MYLRPSKQSYDKGSLGSSLVGNMQCAVWLFIICAQENKMGNSWGYGQTHQTKCAIKILATRTWTVIFAMVTGCCWRLVMANKKLAHAHACP